MRGMLRWQFLKAQIGKMDVSLTDTRCCVCIFTCTCMQIYVEYGESVGPNDCICVQPHPYMCVQASRLIVTQQNKQNMNQQKRNGGWRTEWLAFIDEVDPLKLLA